MESTLTEKETMESPGASLIVTCTVLLWDELEDGEFPPPPAQLVARPNNIIRAIPDKAIQSDFVGFIFPFQECLRFHIFDASASDRGT
jgi:hypothetical protein